MGVILFLEISDTPNPCYGLIYVTEQCCIIYVCVNNEQYDKSH